MKTKVIGYLKKIKDIRRGIVEQRDMVKRKKDKHQYVLLATVCIDEPYKTVLGTYSRESDARKALDSYAKRNLTWLKDFSVELNEQ